MLQQINNQTDSSEREIINLSIQKLSKVRKYLLEVIQREAQHSGFHNFSCCGVFWGWFHLITFGNLLFCVVCYGCLTL